MHRTLCPSTLSVLALWLLSGCGVADTGEAAARPPAPPPECAPLWATPSTQAVVDTIRLATRRGPDLWPGYRPDQVHIAIHAGENPQGESCVGLFQGGEAISYAALREPPGLGNPLYGLYVSYDAAGGPMPSFGRIASQPEAVSSWMASNGARAVVVIPVEPEDFPMELPALLKAQVALHESFHVNVQAPHWMGLPSDWPTWEAPPDRASTRQCYDRDDEIQTVFGEERTALTGLVVGLLDGALPEACDAGREFLEASSSRAAALSAVRIEMGDGTAGSCRDAEAMMEMEEGLADYASWVHLYEIGLATRAQLERRYRAQQRDVFYLTGAMKMHAASLLRGDPIPEARTIIESTSVQDGSPQARVEAALASACVAHW